jgi:hypothetical protein
VPMCITVDANHPPSGRHKLIDAVRSPTAIMWPVQRARDGLWGLRYRSHIRASRRETEAYHQHYLQ